MGALRCSGPPEVPAANFAAMRDLFLALVVLSSLLLTTGCSKDQSDLGNAATITFRTDSGYTWRDDTVPLADTLRISVTVTKGSNKLQSLFVYVNYDNSPAVRQDSVHVTGDPFTFEKTVVTRDQAGKEKWTFSAVENNGDITRRSLTIFKSI